MKRGQTRPSKKVGKDRAAIRERERERAPVSIGFHLELGGRYSCKLWKQLATRPGNIRPANESNIAFDTLSSRVMIFGQGLVRPGRFAGRVRPDACRARTRGTTGVFVWAGNCGQYVAYLTHPSSWQVFGIDRESMDFFFENLAMKETFEENGEIIIFTFNISSS